MESRVSGAVASNWSNGVRDGVGDFGTRDGADGPGARDVADGLGVVDVADGSGAVDMAPKGQKHLRSRQSWLRWMLLT